MWPCWPAPATDTAVLLESANETLDPDPLAEDVSVEWAVTPVVRVLVLPSWNDGADAALGE